MGLIRCVSQEKIVKNLAQQPKSAIDDVYHFEKRFSYNRPMGCGFTEGIRKIVNLRYVSCMNRFSDCVRIVLPAWTQPFHVSAIKNAITFFTS